ncbi:hypothetical protein BpHYR1_052217 [Brachionus plicatilis]|uniref:Uncharacterized protein n=1 Tax=Brachionus plicatilis TaxID=10195 RepID=A0A3M7REV1_BRAPC|nr:hypothetical protein BpHYR1_052217 [Brachionus plicatilis]
MKKRVDVGIKAKRRFISALSNKAQMMRTIIKKLKIIRKTLQTPHGVLVNLLPSYVVNAVTVNGFRSKLDAHMASGIGFNKKSAILKLKSYFLKNKFLAWIKM